MPKRYLYLIRNGHYNRSDDTIEGQLTEVGKRQAQLTANTIVHMPIHEVHCSPYEQVRETAHAIVEGLHLGLSETGLLRQYDSFAMEDGTLTRKQFLNALENQQEQLTAAYVAFVQPPPADEDYHECLVCHANIIRDLICKGMHVNPATWAHMIINHCGISLLTIDLSGQVELVAYNDVKHLPDSLKTE